MTVVSIPDNDTSWVDLMCADNAPLNFDLGGEDNAAKDSDEKLPEFEIPLDDDLCNAQMIARSVVTNMQFNNEVFSSSYVQNSFKVGMIFESKSKLLQ